MKQQNPSDPNQTQNVRNFETSNANNSYGFVRDSLAITVAVAGILMLSNMPVQADESNPINSATSQKPALSSAQRLISASAQVEQVSVTPELQRGSLNGTRIASHDHTDTGHHYYSHSDKPFSDSAGVHTDQNGGHWDTHEDAFGKISAHQDFGVSHTDVTTRHLDTGHQDVPKGTHADTHADHSDSARNNNKG